MLRDAVEKCPDDLWTNAAHEAPCWGVAYHALFFAHLYSRRRSEEFQPWERHQADVQYPDGIPGPPEPGDQRPLLGRPYTKADVLGYWTIVDGLIDASVDAMDLASPESGFSWYKVPKLEHQIVNIRHIEHHTAQLAARVRIAADVGIEWVGARRDRRPQAGTPR